MGARAGARGPRVLAGLVAFFGGPGSRSASACRSSAGCALGWGEPLIPWWGPVGFIGSPCWYGWGGPRVVNNIVINNGDDVNANAVTQYRNLHVPGGVVSVERKRFNDWNISRARLTDVRTDQLRAIQGQLPVQRGATSLTRAGSTAPPDLSNRTALADARRQWSSGTANFSRSAPTGAPADQRAALANARRDWSSSSANLSRSAPANSGSSGPPPLSAQRGADHRAAYQTWSNGSSAPQTRAAQPSRDLQRRGDPPPLTRSSSAVSRYSGRSSSAAPPPPRLESSHRLADVRRGASPPPAPAARRDASRNAVSSAPPARPGGYRFGAYSAPSRVQSAPNVAAGTARSFDRAPSGSFSAPSRSFSMPSGGGGSIGGRSMGGGGGGGGGRVNLSR